MTLLLEYGWHNFRCLSKRLATHHWFFGLFKKRITSTYLIVSMDVYWKFRACSIGRIPKLFPSRLACVPKHSVLHLTLPHFWWNIGFLVSLSLLGLPSFANYNCYRPKSSFLQSPVNFNLIIIDFDFDFSFQTSFCHVKMISQPVSPLVCSSRLRPKNNKLCSFMIVYFLVQTLLKNV